MVSFAISTSATTNAALSLHAPRARRVAVVAGAQIPADRIVSDARGRDTVRGFARAAALASFLTLAAPLEPARAANAPTDPATSPLVQELLRRTEENREARYKERLDDYNRRNFADYFDVVDKGYNGKHATENDEAIREQLQRWRAQGK